MSIARWLLCAALILTATATLADDDDFTPSEDAFLSEHLMARDPFPIFGDYHSSGWTITVGGAADFVFFINRTNVLGNSNPASSSPDDIFTVNQTYPINGDLFLRVGHQNTINTHLFSVGLEYHYALKETINGSRVDSSGNTTPYSFNLQRQALLLVGQLGIAHWGFLQPYFEAGAGASANRFSGFKNTNSTAPMYAFPNKTTFSFSGLLGCGFNVPLSTAAVMSIGYRLMYWGSMDSGTLTSVPNPTPVALSEPINLSNGVLSHQGLLSLTFII
jgi:opacity protein-like surface antigen